jgi:predicted membrane protein
MTDDIKDIKYNKDPNRGRVMAGVILLIVGGVLLIKQFDFFFFPSWLFSWPMWLIAWGLYLGAKHSWRNSSGVIMLIIGVAFLLDKIIPGYNMHDVAWPLILICVGIWIILRRTKPHDRDYWEKKWSDKWHEKKSWKYSAYNTDEPVVDYTATPDVPPTDVPPSASGTRRNADDYLDAVSIFGGVKKTILSKDFKGGEIVNVFGGAELDFTQANINGQVVIDITQIFGGTKIVVPPHWRVVPDLAAVFASVDDKRIRTTAAADSDKILVLKGTSIFAGVDIRSY